MPTPDSTTKHAQAQRLRAEIDRLALMLSEVKNQAERIQAAADSLGDEVFSRLNVEESVGEGSPVLVFPQNAHWKKQAVKRSPDTA